MAWVYMLRGTTGRFYIGVTDDLQRRLSQHQGSQVHTTRRLGLPLELVATKELPTMTDARAWERRLKAKRNPALALFYLRG